MKRALVISLICVLGLAFSGLAATLSGSWDTDVTIDPQQTGFNDAIGIVSVLTVAYTVGDWTFTSVTDLDENGWTDQDFAVAGVLGAFSLSSALDFTPATASFGYWNTNASVAIAGVSFGVDFWLANNDVALILTGSGVAGDVTIDVEVTFGDLVFASNGLPTDSGNNVCDLNWSGVTIDIGFPFCCADIALEVEFNCTGFVSATFTTGGIAIPNLPWVTIDAELVYTLDNKTLELSPNFDFGAIVCFDLYFDVATTGNITLGDISIGGIGLSCDIGAVTFTGISIWDANISKTGTLLAKSGGIYWEAYQIATNDDACCGPFSFDLAFYFLQGGARLFDVALIDANMSLQVAAQFLFNMGLEVNVESGAFSEWTVGFLVTW